MKIIKPSVEFFGVVPTDYENTLRFIEMAGRTCYKSEDRITANSAEGFVKKLIKAKHLAMVEHSNFVVKCGFENESEVFFNLASNPHLSFNETMTTFYIGGNLTAWLHSWNKFNLCAFTEPFFSKWGDFFNLRTTRLVSRTGTYQAVTEFPAELERHTFKFICDRGVSHELVRHRPCSFAQESTRYVNYAGKDMEFIEPWWWEREKVWQEPDADHSDSQLMWRLFIRSCEDAEECYNEMVRIGTPPQAARAVLPNALKTEIVVTADAAEWEHIKKLRTHSSAHPDMVCLMNMMPWEEIGL